MPTKQKETALPRHQEAKSILSSWRSCQTDRDRHKLIKSLRQSHPLIADNLSKLIIRT
jgi:hypothetical protein